jgi:hypothetical protein
VTAGTLLLPYTGMEVQAATPQVKSVICTAATDSMKDYGTPDSTMVMNVELYSTSAVREDTTFYLNLDIGDLEVLGASEDPIEITVPYGKDYATKEITFSCKKEGVTRYSITDMDNTTVYYTHMFYVNTPGVYPDEEINLTPENPSVEVSCVQPDGEEVGVAYSSDTSVVTYDRDTGTLNAVGNGTANVYFLGKEYATVAVVNVSGFDQNGNGDWVLYGSFTALRNAFMKMHLDRYTMQNNLANDLQTLLQENRIVEPVDPSDLSFDVYAEGNNMGGNDYVWTAPVQDDTYQYLSQNVFPYIGIYEVQESEIQEAGTTTTDSYALYNFCKSLTASIANGGLQFDQETGKISVTPGYLQQDTEYILFIDHNLVTPSEDTMDVNVYVRFHTMSLTDAFADLVNQLTYVTYTEDTRALLERCKNAYDQMSEEEKNSEEGVEAYEKYVYYNSVYEVMDEICQIGEVTRDSGEKIDNARYDYDMLSEEQQAMITDDIYEILTSAEQAYQELIRTQTITTEKDTYTVSYGTKSFSLNTEVTGDGTISYEVDEDGASVVKVSSKGVVSILGIGTAIVTIKASETEDFNAAEKKIRIRVEKGTQTITASTKYNNTSFSLNASSSGNQKLKYTSSDKTVATVSSSGVVKVVGAGMVTITISAEATNYYKAANKNLVYYFAPQKDKTYTVSGLKYKVTNADTKGKGTVTLTGATSTTITSLTVKDTVKLGGYTYKVTAVGASAFKNYKKLKTIIIGTNVTTIGKNAFYGDSKVTKVTIKSTKLTTVGTNAFKGIPAKTVFKVPSSKKTAYKKLLSGRTVQ